MKISEVQRHIWRIYRHHDTKRGIEKTFNWFKSEVRELDEAIKSKDTTLIKEEMADVLAWLISIANLLNLELERIFIEKYGEGCPKCKSIPCRCEYRETP